MTVFIASPSTDYAAGAHVPLHPGQHRSARHLGLRRVIALTAIVLIALDRLYGLDRLLRRSRKATMIELEPDVAVIGGGLVGGVDRLGPGARSAQRVDDPRRGRRRLSAPRAAISRWSGCSRRASACPTYAALDGAVVRGLGAGSPAALKDETGIDVAHQPAGRLHALRCPKRNWSSRVDADAAAAQPAGDDPDTPTRCSITPRRSRRLPDIGPEVVGAIYCPLDGHVNSLKLFRALHEAIAATRRATIARTIRSRRIAPRDGAFRRVRGRGARSTPGKVVLAAGLGNARARADGRARCAGAAEQRPDHRHRKGRAVPATIRS